MCIITGVRQRDLISNCSPSLPFCWLRSNKHRSREVWSANRWCTSICGFLLDNFVNLTKEHFCIFLFFFFLHISSCGYGSMQSLMNLTSDVLVSIHFHKKYKNHHVGNQICIHYCHSCSCGVMQTCRRLKWVYAKTALPLRDIVSLTWIYADFMEANMFCFSQFVGNIQISTLTYMTSTGGSTDLEPF